MTTDSDSVSLARQGSIMATTVLAGILAAMIPAALYGVVPILYRVLGASFGWAESIGAAAIHFDLSYALFMTVALGFAIILAAPLPILVGRISKLKHVVAIVVAATAVSYALSIMQLSGSFVGDLFYELAGPHRMNEDGTSAGSSIHEFIDTWSRVPLLSLTGVACVHWLLIVFFCVLYRLVWRRRAGSPSPPAGELPILTGANPLADKRQFWKIAASIIVVIGASMLLYRVNQLAGVSSTAWKALRQPREMIVYSLGGGNQAASDSIFSKHGIYGRTSVTALVDQRAVYASVRESVTSSYHFGGWPMCFSPRHGVRVTDGTHTYDFLICYECIQMGVFRDGEPVSGILIGGSRDTLDGILRAANVPLEFPPANVPLDSPNSPEEDFLSK